MHNLFIKDPAQSDLTNLSVTEINSIPKNSNPFLYDSIRSGVDITKDLTVMFNTVREGMANDELILINTRTGQRWILEQTAKEPEFLEYVPLPHGSDHERGMGFYWASLHTKGPECGEAKMIPISEGRPVIHTPSGAIPSQAYFVFGNHAFHLQSMENLGLDGFIELAESELPVFKDTVKAAFTKLTEFRKPQY